MGVEPRCVQRAAAHHEGGHLLPPALVRKARHRGLRHRRVDRKHALDLGGQHILAAGDDHVVDPARHEEVAIGVAIADIAGEIPALLERPRVRVRPPPVAGEGFVALQARDHLAFRAGGDGAVGIARADLYHADALVDAGLARRAGLGSGVLIDGEGVDLRRAVMVNEEFGPEGVGDPAQQPLGHRRAGETQFAHRGDIGTCESRTPQQVVIERRHQVEGGDPLGLDQAERALRLEARLADEGAAHRRHGEQRAHTHGVIERHDAERALAGAIAVLRDVGECGGAFGAMSPRYALAAPGGARGVEHERDVVFAGTGRGFGRRRQQVCEWRRALGRGAGPDAPEPRGTGGVSHRRSGGPVEG